MMDFITKYLSKEWKNIIRLNDNHVTNLNYRSIYIIVLVDIFIDI